MGILTEDPQGMFHVDPKSDTQGSLNTSDDVIVTMEGNVGIGILPDDAASPPTLTLTGGGTPSVPRSPLRIEDGNQQEGRVLTSNAAGQGTWKDLPAGFTPGRVYGLTGIPAISLGMVTVFTFTADAAGRYLFEIRWRGKYNALPQYAPYTIFELFRGSTTVDTFEQYTGVNHVDYNVCSLCLTLYGEALAAGNIFTLRIRAANREQDTQAIPAWTQAKVNVLRVN